MSPTTDYPPPSKRDGLPARWRIPTLCGIFVALVIVVAIVSCVLSVLR